METPRDPQSIETPEESASESAIVDGRRVRIGAWMVAVAAAAFLGVMVMAVFAGSRSSDPSRAAAWVVPAVLAILALALAGVVLVFRRARAAAHETGRTARGWAEME